MAKTFVIANRKGGVGKTTTAMAMAYIFETKGYKTLLIDADQQGNSTDTYGAAAYNTTTLYDMLLDADRENIPVSEAVQHTKYGDIIASDQKLNEADTRLGTEVDGLYRMQDLIDRIEGYDAVVIDTAPTFNSIMISSLIAADEVIIPVTADRYALQGLSMLNDVIRRIKKRQNPAVRVTGVLLTKYNGQLTISREVKEGLAPVTQGLGTSLFETEIRECSKTRMAQAARIPLMQYAPKCTTAEDYIKFTDEVLSRTGMGRTEGSDV